MPQSKRLKLAHLIALDTVGGVERIYSDFLEQTGRAYDHYTINDRDIIAPVIEPKIRNHSVSTYSVKRKENLRLPAWPKVLRQNNLKRILHDIQADLLIVWNKIEGISKQIIPDSTKVVYYEHGAGWHSKSPRLVCQFLKDVDAVICNSKAALSVLRHNWQLPSDKNVRIIYNPLNSLMEVSPEPTTTRAVGQPFRLGLASRLVSVKGIPIAIHATQILVTQGYDVTLTIAGTGKDQSNLIALVDRLNLKDKVSFVGLVNEMSDFYRSIDCLLCPSIREPFGLAAAEAMTFGCPVVGAMVDGLAEVIEEGITGFRVQPKSDLHQYQKLGGQISSLPKLVYCPECNQVRPPKAINPEDLANKIKFLISEEEKYQEMSRNAAERARQRFGSANYLKLIDSAIQQVVEV